MDRWELLTHMGSTLGNDQIWVISIRIFSSNLKLSKCLNLVPSVPTNISWDKKPLKSMARIRASFRSHDFEARSSGEASRHPGGCHQQRAAHQAPQHQPVGQGRWTLSTWSCATTTAARSADGLPASESGGSSPASATTAAWTQIRLQQLRISATSARFTLAKLFWYLSPIVSNGCLLLHDQLSICCCWR